MNEIVKPPRLKAGDTIGIVAPASPFDMDKFKLGLAALENIGFATVAPREIFHKEGYLAGSDNHRAHVINRFFADDTVRGIFCARGGYGSLRILSLLDKGLIEKHPKVFAGFSDISVVLNHLSGRCGLVTFHAPMVTSLATATKKTRESLAGAVLSGEPVEIEAGNGTALFGGTASGPVAGGNLTTLCHLVGTPFAPRFSGRILFLEDTGEAPYRIDRMLTQMQIAGCLTGVAGVVLGSFTDCGDLAEIHRIVAAIFEPSGVPVLAGIDAGHGNENLTLPIGLTATLDADRKVLRYSGPATE